MPVHEDAKRAIDFIRKSNRDGKPFYINLWIHEPHTPFHTVPKYEWRFREMENREDQIYASVLSHADDRIGEILNELDRLKVTENTLVIFSSDNGPARASGPSELDLHYDTATGAGWGIAAAKGLTAGRKGYKSALFEGGIGVPFIARWPGQIAEGNIDNSSLFSAVDLLPTFCEIAGVELPDGYEPDGISQVAPLLGKPTKTRIKPLFWKMQSPWPIQKARPYHWVSFAMVHKNWKLLTNQDSTYCELYDVTKDPLETVNVSTKYPEVVEQMLKDLDGWKSTLPSSPSGDVFSIERSQSTSN
jgi:N-acetylgalactosamine-6-sulfatase